MPPKLPADHPVKGPKMEPTPEDRVELVEGETEEAREDQEQRKKEQEEASSNESILQELSAAASALVPEGGVGEGPGAGGRSNLIFLLLFILGIAAAVLIYLYAT